jgi:hypothetical protein
MPDRARWFSPPPEPDDAWKPEWHERLAVAGAVLVAVIGIAAFVYFFAFVLPKVIAPGP